MQTHPEHPNIYTISNIQSLLKSRKISFNTTIFWDLDNTVLQPSQELGSDQWFCGFHHLAKTKLGTNFKFEYMIETYNAVQAHVVATTVEEKTIQIIKFLAAAGIHQGFITARNHELKEITKNQLRSVGITPNKHPIIYCNGGDKGKILIQHLWHRPRHLIMIDDKLENIVNIQTALERFNIPFNGFHYDFLREKVESFDIGCAHFQLSLIQHKLPIMVKEFIHFLELSWEAHHEEENSSHLIMK